MNRKRNPRWVLATAFAISSTTLFTAAAQAQNVAGSFTLPYAAHWGSVALAAGHYTFSAPSSVEPFLVTVRGEGTTAMIMAQGRRMLKGDQSSLQLIVEGNQAVVSSLQLAPYGLTFTYGLSHRPPVQVEASNRPSEKTRRSGTDTVARATIIDVPAKVTGR
jgi:hypothetical protein